MRGPYSFQMSENCQSCKLRKDGFFCQLQTATLKDFDARAASSVHQEGAVLFMEKQESRGVFVLCEGQVKLSISSSEGKTLILRIAKPGEALGLTAVIAGTPYEMTAETLRPSQIVFVRRDDFLRFLAHHPEAYQNVVKQVASSYDVACEQLRTVGLSSPVRERLAKVLLEWSQGVKQAESETRINMPLTHEEIGELIGTSRETVTRTFSEFKNHHLIALNGSTVTISDRAALEHVAAA